MGYIAQRCLFGKAYSLLMKQTESKPHALDASEDEKHRHSQGESCRLRKGAKNA